MQIERKPLLDALSCLKLAVAKKGEVEQLTHFIFTGEEIVTFNNQMAVFLEFKSDFVCSIKADLFHKQLSKFSSPNVSMVLTKGRLILQGEGEKTTFKVNTDKDDEVFKVLHAIQNDHADCERLQVPGNFAIGTAFSSFSTSKNAHDGVLGAVCVKGKYIYSTDQYRATQFTMESSIKDTFLIKGDIANNFNNFNIRHFSVGDSWLSFYCENGITLSIRKIFGDYPNFSNAFEVDNWDVVEFPEDITDAIDFVSVIISKEEKLRKIGKVVIEGDKVTISTNHLNEESEKTVHLTDTRVEKKIEFNINMEFFKTILQHTLKLHYNSETQRAMFTNGNFKHLIRMALA